MPINHRLMPNLRPGAYRITSPASPRYNCVAWAAGVDDRWWDPAEGYPWPDDLPRDVTIETLVRVYERLGFAVCGDARPEPGCEKIVIYGAHGEWEHVARLLDTGKWTSKMGPDEDIEHDGPEDLAGGAFGSVARVMRRPVAASEPRRPAGKRRGRKRKDS